MRGHDRGSNRVEASHSINGEAQRQVVRGVEQPEGLHRVVRDGPPPALVVALEVALRDDPGLRERPLRSDELIAILQAIQARHNYLPHAALKRVTELSNLSMALILVVGGRLTMVNTISAGDFVAFNSYLLLLTWPMMALGWMINLFQRGAASLGRIQRILDTGAEVADSNKTDADGTIDGVIECRGLTFTYPGATWSALRDIRLRIEPGRFVGVVGRTGAGKSTFLKLIPRLYEVADGQLYLDGKELHRWPLSRLRGSIAMVPQEPFIFADSVRANICFGRPDAGEDEMIKAAATAQLLEEIRGLPRQFDTLLGERGVSLSGGQKQRLTLARALLLDRPVLILDDCLSSVDVETEVAILGNLRHYLKGRTTIMASQRLEAMRSAEIIFVLDRGELRESGNHEELLALDGTYATLYRRQQLEAELKVRSRRG